MTSVQLKSEIQEALDQIPEKVLPYVLDFLKELKSKPEGDVELADFLMRTLSEDKELLKKLAE
jgi:hypothetical protein